MTYQKEDIGNSGILIVVIALVNQGISLLNSNLIYGVIILLISVGLLILRAYLQKQGWNIGKK